jgi:hypothetical protein
VRAEVFLPLAKILLLGGVGVVGESQFLIIDVGELVVEGAVVTGCDFGDCLMKDEI